MKLTDMQKKPSYKELNKVTESRFGVSIDYDNLTVAQARKMRSKIDETISKIRSSSAIHKSEKSPKYLEMLMVRESLNSWIKEKRHLAESEMAQAQVMLAAKDMVDTVQDMIEKVGKLQNEQLPALGDAIRDSIGAAQADTYKSTVGGVLGSLVQQLNQARDQLDQQARGLSGEEVPDMAMPEAGADAGMGGEDLGLPTDGGEEFDLGAEGDGFDATDAAAGGPEEAGRELR